MKQSWKRSQELKVLDWWLTIIKELHLSSREQTSVVARRYHSLVISASLAQIHSPPTLSKTFLVSNRLLLINKLFNKLSMQKELHHHANRTDYKLSKSLMTSGGSKYKSSSTAVKLKSKSKSQMAMLLLLAKSIRMLGPPRTRIPTQETWRTSRATLCKRSRPQMRFCSSIRLLRLSKQLIFLMRSQISSSTPPKVNNIWRLLKMLTQPAKASNSQKWREKRSSWIPTH